MNTERYETVLDLITQKKDWALRNAICFLPIKNRAVPIEGVFLHAASQHDDTNALEYWEFLKRGLWDITLNPFFKVENDKTFILWDGKIPEAKSQAQAACAAKAKEFWGKVPRFRIEKKAKYKDGVWVDEEHPTLLETKRALLSEIAICWRDTQDEQEASEIFGFLISIKLAYGEGKILLDVMRKETDARFPSVRLARNLARLASIPKLSLSGGQFRNELEKILAIAWARNTEFKKIVKIIKTTLPLFEASDSAFDLLERQARTDKIMDSAVTKLLRSMKGEIILSSLERIYGEIDVFYLTESTIDITIVDEELSTRGRPFDDHKSHNIFEAARKHILHWLNAYPDYSVHLRFIVLDKYDSKNRLFYREQMLK